MFSRRYQQFVSKLAMFLVLFASLAPTVSHAMAARNGINTITQEICSTSGIKKIVVQTVTTKGQQVTATFNGKSNNTPEAALHLEHCPFCSANASHISIAPQTPAWVAMVEAQAEAVNQDFVVPAHADPLLNAHLSRAPPQL
jgi:hypothetical protein